MDICICSDCQEARKWIVDKTGVGGGSHPISFLIASHEEMNRQRHQSRKEADDALARVAKLEEEIKQLQKRLHDREEKQQHVMNQCDGCNAKRPLVKVVGGKFIEDPINGDTHIMGSLEPGKYADLMQCQRYQYDATIKEMGDSWLCPSCQRWNSLSNLACTSCSYPRAEE